MTERPILFSGSMVRALLAGRKTQTRRVVKPQPPEDHAPLVVEEIHRVKVDRHGEEYPGEARFGVTTTDGEWCLPCPYGAPGDRLWVRENGWERPERSPRDMREGADTWEPFYYDADLTDADHEQFKAWGFKRRPSIHMARRFCRLELEITAVRAEPLQAITEDDARAEGAEPYLAGQDAAGPLKTHRTGFVHLWQSINGTWLENPWVWVVEFKRIPSPPQRREGESI